MPLNTLTLLEIRLNLAEFSNAFTDEELELYYTVQQRKYPDFAVEATTAYSLYRLVSGAVSFVDFVQGETSEKQSVIYKRLWDLWQWWRNQAGVNDDIKPAIMYRVRLYETFNPTDPEQYGWNGFDGTI